MTKSKQKLVFPPSPDETTDDIIYKRFSGILKEPLFTPRCSLAIIEDLTYRKLNDWDSKDLLRYSRDKKEGWRKFSVVELIRINLISGLRRFGYDTEKIRKVLDQIYHPEETTNPSLEKYIINCIEGNKILLLIDEDENLFFFSEKEAITHFFPFEHNSSPLLILPFFDYVQEVAKIELKTSPSSSVAKMLIDEKEKRIIEIIRSNKFEEISIVRSNGENLTIRHKSRIQKSLSNDEIINLIHAREYQKITTATVGGKITSAIIEESIKV